MPTAAPFSQILGELAGEADADATPEMAVSPAQSLGKTALPLGITTCDAEPAWNRATEWIADLEESQDAVSAKDLPSDDPAEMRRELGLDNALTLEELRRLRREFVWSNHPDRRLNIPASLANSRVAIANMLIDDAMRTLSPPAVAREDGQ